MDSPKHGRHNQPVACAASRWRTCPYWYHQSAQTSPAHHACTAAYFRQQRQSWQECLRGYLPSYSTHAHWPTSRCQAYSGYTPAQQTKPLQPRLWRVYFHHHQPSWQSSAQCYCPHLHTGCCFVCPTYSAYLHPRILESSNTQPPLQTAYIVRRPPVRRCDWCNQTAGLTA